MTTSLSLSRLGWFGGALGAAVFALAGCGGGNGSCGGGACGGNVVGTWSITSECTSSGQTTSTTGCTTQIDISGLKETGTITFNSDLTYSATISISGGETETISPQCLTSTTCDAENTAIMQQVTSGTFSSASCAAGSAGCVCQLMFAARTLTETGTYSTSGSSLTTAMTGSTSSSTDTYCVLGSTLTLSSMSMVMAGMTGPSSSVVLTKI
jgi:hypothetical protein